MRVPGLVDFEITGLIKSLHHALADIVGVVKVRPGSRWAARHSKSETKIVTKAGLYRTPV